MQTFPYNRVMHLYYYQHQDWFCEKAGYHQRELLQRQCLNWVLKDPEYQSIEPTKTVREASGKLILEPSCLHLGITHKSGWTVLAIAKTAVGIDLERKDRGGDHDLITSRFYPNAFKSFLSQINLEPDDFTLSFSLLESYAKAKGCGLQALLDHSQEFCDLKQMDFFYYQSKEHWLTLCVRKDFDDEVTRTGRVKLTKIDPLPAPQQQSAFLDDNSGMGVDQAGFQMGRTVALSMTKAGVIGDDVV